MIIKAYAKVNISLKVLGKRPDGYHNLSSFMQAVPDLYDVLEIAESDETKISTNCEGLSCGDDNLVAKALKAMGKKANVHIEKHIPIAAGLAGGSADAAATIYAFLGASKEAFDLASSLGSDIPFSLYAIQKQGRAAALASSTGIELKEIEPLPYKIKIICPNLAVSTPAVYKEYDRMLEEGILPKLLELPVETGEYGNDLEAPAISLCPEIAKSLADLREEYKDAIKVQQSGSGPSCFALIK